MVSLSDLWKVWISYPQGKGKTYAPLFAVWKVWKTYPRYLGIKYWRRKSSKMSRLSTVIVDNLVEKCAEVHMIAMRDTVHYCSVPC
jgi:hypothetical protein